MNSARLGIIVRVCGLPGQSIPERKRGAVQVVADPKEVVDFLTCQKGRVTEMRSESLRALEFCGEEVKDNLRDTLLP
jgi:hypothetical protein